MDEMRSDSIMAGLLQKYGFPAKTKRQHRRAAAFWKRFDRHLIETWMEAPTCLRGRCALNLGAGPRSLRKDLDTREDLPPVLLAEQMLERYVRNVESGVFDPPPRGVSCSRTCE